MEDGVTLTKREEIYDNEVSPLVAKIIEVCRERNDIPFVLSAQLNDDRDGEGDVNEDGEALGEFYCSTVTVPENGGKKLHRAVAALRPDPKPQWGRVHAARRRGPGVRGRLAHGGRRVMDLHRSESERKARAIVKEVGRGRCLTLHVEQDEEGRARVVWQVPPGVQVGSANPLAAGEDDAAGEASTLDVVAELLAVESHADIASEILQLIGDRMRLTKELDELRSTLRKALG
ncbi:MAG: hypothetical protein SangKO_010860 [Sandaracinaceae bacterium]